MTFRAPAEEIQLAPVEYSIQPVDEDERFDLDPGTNLVELRVHRQMGVRFTFTDGEATIPWNWSWRLSAHRVDGEARDVARSIGILWFREEGTYELRSEGIPGYESIDGIRIDVRAGHGVIEIDVPLVGRP